MTTPFSVSEFLADPRSDEQRLEFIDGETIRRAPRTWGEGRAVLHAAVLLEPFGKVAIAVRAVIGECSLILDVAFFRVDAPTGTEYVTRPPHVVVELVMEDRPQQLAMRRRELLEWFGVEEVWFVDMRDATLTVRSRGVETVLSPGDPLTSEAVRGLECDAARLFAD